jgi:carboxymethylenebutenolidase
MNDGMTAETVTITGAGGDQIEAYLARPTGDDGPYGAVVVIHHMPGYDEATKEIARRFAHHRYIAICPNLYTREAPGASPDDAAAAVRAAGGVPDDRLVGDVGGAAEYARSLGSSNGKVATIGYCSGGRQSFLAACSLDLDAAVDCYGAFVVAKPPEGVPLKVGPLAHLAPNLSCALLGLFGAEDKYPAPEETEELAGILKESGKDFEFHTFDNAGHGFFAVDRPSYRPEAAQEGWAKIWDFFGRHLSGGKA